MVCPPCHGFEPKSAICVAGCGLRDRLKDLDVLQKLGLLPGATLKARDLYALLFERVPHSADICDYGEGHVREWRACGGSFSGNYEKGREKGIAGSRGGES